MKLGVVVSHPIQYYSPLFKALAPEIDLTVFYCDSGKPDVQAAAGFGVEFQWDTPLLEGYEFRFLNNVYRRPGIGHFFGLDTPEIRAIVGGQEWTAFMVIGWNRKSFWQAITACNHSRVPVLMRGDSHLGMRTRLANSLKRLPLSVAMKRIDWHLVPGERNAEYLQWLGVKPQRLWEVPHFVDTSHFATGKCSNRRREVLYVGKLIDVKRPFHLMQAFETASLSKEWTLVYVGDGPMMDQLKTYAADRGLNVQFRGFVNQARLPELYADASILVLPSELETWGLVVNEACAAGVVPLVMEGAGCAPSVRRFFGNDSVCDNHDMLPDALAQLANGFEDGFERRSRCAQMYTRYHSVDHAKERMMELLENRL